MVIEPGRFPLPLLYEAVTRGAECCLTGVERDAVRRSLIWACRPLRAVVAELHGWASGNSAECGPTMGRMVANVLAIQEDIGNQVSDYLADHDPEWLDDIGQEVWAELGGW